MPRDLKGGAYQVQESYEGPPLSYISEKMTKAIETQYHLIKNISKYVPDDLTSPLLKSATPSINLKEDFLASDAYMAFN